jgi:adenosylcobinamide-phosphate synthase
MSLFIIIIALLLAHYRPSALSEMYLGVIGFFERKFNDGQFKHGLIAWLLAVLSPTLLVFIACMVLKHFSSLLYFLVAIAALYLMLESVDFSATAEAISNDLRDGNIAFARERLAQWSGYDTREYGAAEIARVTIETILLRAHAGLLAPIFWFVIFESVGAGPAGVVLYRLAQLTQQAWQSEGSDFNRAAQRAFYWLDWLPAHVTAISFAVVGNFEDAMYCWRTQVDAWKNRTLAIMLASGAGAMGVKLGEPLFANGVLEYRPELGLGDVAYAEYVMSAVGLVWRALVLLLTMVLLMTFANWLGK